MKEDVLENLLGELEKSHGNCISTELVDGEIIINVDANSILASAQTDLEQMTGKKISRKDECDGQAVYTVGKIK